MMSHFRQNSLNSISGQLPPISKPGQWLPLPHIHSGIVTHPFHPLATPPTSPYTPRAESSKQAASRNRFSWSGVDAGGGKGREAIGGVGIAAGGEEDSTSGGGRPKGKENAYEVPLDVGDEVYAFEEYREMGGGESWYRGYVVQAVSLSSLAPTPPPSPTPLTSPAAFPRPEPSVLIGIFPASCVHMRPGAPNDDGTLRSAYEKAIKMAEQRAANGSSSTVPPAPGMGFGGDMEPLQEEDEDGLVDGGSSPGVGKGTVEGEVVDIAPGAPSESEPTRGSSKAANGISRPNRPKSLVLEGMISEQNKAGGAGAGTDEADKEQPPLPKLTAGDSTIAGQQWPLVDEIACAIREWYARLPTYLANREYRLFSTVMQHIDALFLGRRQLLSQTLSGDELTRVRRECVSRLVKCNVAQGLEVIVRSLEDGSVMVVNRDRAFSGASWIGGIACYVYQVQLAYIDLIPLDTLFGTASSLIAPTRLLGSVPSSSIPSRPYSLSSKAARPLSDPTSSSPFDAPIASYLHLLLDIRAFIASPCSPGETAELYFSLFNKTENRFLTEEFCLVLSHLGSPARDPEQRLGRLRTLFTELKSEDLGGATYLVCKIVRNGAMKVRGEGGDGASGFTLGRNGTIRRQAPPTLGTVSEVGTYRASESLHPDAASDDSFSVTSGFGGHRPGTVDTSFTTAASTTLEGRPAFRRPFGCAVIELPVLSKLLTSGGAGSDQALEFNMPIFVPREESRFATLHEDIVHDRTREFGTTNRAETIAISLKLLQGSAPQLVREHPSLLLDVPHSARLGFPDVVPPSTKRNDLYLKLWSGSFFPVLASSGGSIRMRKSVIGPSASHQNIQVTLELRRSNDGMTLPDAITAGGAGEPAVTSYHSMVFAHNDKPTFGELVKVSPPRGVDCHLYLTVRSRASKASAAADPNDLEKPFAFAYLPLFDGARGCIKDGSHDLVLYRMERGLHPTPHVYFDAPSCAPAEGAEPEVAIPRNMLPLRDRVTLRSFLCSSVHSQDDTLRRLLAWQSLDGATLRSTLQVFAFVGEEEIGKFVPAVLDALFGTLVSINSPDQADDLEQLVFQSLVKVLAMSSDRRFPNFKPVLDVYIDRYFNHPASSSHLLRSMKHIMTTPSSKEYRSLLKVWHLVFRFVIRARELDRQRGLSGLESTSRHIEADFQRQMRGILAELVALMRQTDKTLIGTQTLAVQHYADILPDLARLFPPLEIAEMVIAFADTLYGATAGLMVVYKLMLLLEVVRSLFDNAQARALLVPAMVRWVKPHLGRCEAGGSRSSQGEEQVKRDERRAKWMEGNRLAVTVVAWMINKLQEWLASPVILEDAALRQQEEENIEYCLGLLPSLLQSSMELASPQTTSTLSRLSSPATFKPTPDIFPSSHPFALAAQLPPPSLLERHQHAELDGLPQPSTFHCGLAECAVVVLTLVLTAPQPILLRYLRETLDIEGLDACSSLLSSLLDFSLTLLVKSPWPKQWLTLNLMAHQAILLLLRPISTLLTSSPAHAFIPPPQRSDEFDVALWGKVFELLVEFCGSEELALEDQSQQRRRAAWVIAGDLRDEASGLLTGLWGAVGWSGGAGGSGVRYGGYQTRFTGLAGKILGLCLSSHDAMCETAVEILFSMIYAEYVLAGKFDQIEGEIFAKLETLFLSKSGVTSTGDPAMRAYFVAQLRAVFETTPTPDERFTQHMTSFLDSLELFIDLLLALRELPETPRWKDERAAATLHLLRFVQRIGRRDLYLRFVHQLVGINREVKDWIGAGMALKLHADLHDWKVGGDWVDDFESPADEGGWRLPAQSEFERKEAIYFRILEYYAEAEAFELALELCQELTAQHQRLTFNIAKLSQLLVHQARLWEKIGSSARKAPEYYRVAYFGDFPPLLRLKDLIVRAGPWQRYSEYCESLQQKHPQAMIHRSKIPPPETVRKGEEQVIWVTSVQPLPDTSRAVFQDGVRDEVRGWWKANGVKRWESRRPYLMDPGEKEGVLTWTERTILTTADELPGLLSRAEVVGVEFEQISPIQNALSEVDRATKNLRGLSSSRRGVPVDAKQLGTAINGAVDSPVNGGVKLYRQTFLERRYLDRYPNDSLAVEQLRQALLDYVRAVQEALTVHKDVCKDIAYHEALKSHFHKAFPEEIALLPRHSDSTLSSFPMPPIHPVQPSSTSPPPLPHKDTHSPRISLQSDGTHTTDFTTVSASASTSSGYVLPPLRLGPSSGPSSPTPMVDVANLRRAPSVPAKSSRSSNATPPSLGSRALSIVGSVRGSGGSGRSRDSASVVSEGTVDAGGEGEGGNGVKKERGLKRFGSLIRRNQK